MRPDWTTCFSEAVEMLGEYAAGRRLEGSYYAWERLNILARHLRRVALLADGAPDVRQARRMVETYARDLARHYLKPDAWTLNWLESFERALQGAPEQPLKLVVSTERPAAGTRWGNAYLTVPAAWPEAAGAESDPARQAQ